MPLFLWRHSARMRSIFAESNLGSPEGTNFNGCDDAEIDDAFIFETYTVAATNVKGTALRCFRIFQALDEIENQRFLFIIIFNTNTKVLL